MVAIGGWHQGRGLCYLTGMANNGHTDEALRGGKEDAMRPKDLRGSDLSEAIGRADDFASVAVKFNDTPEETHRLDLLPTDYLTSDGTEDGTPLTVNQLISYGVTVATPGRKPGESDGSTS